MLIISRSPGESLVIGRSQLVVRAVQPSLRLDLMEHGLVKEVAFSRQEVAGQPTVQLRDAQVFIQRIQRGRVVLGIEAPREVPVLKGEWSGGASG
jgi:sRNA-binding carbon storage regulator CsrA